MFELRFDWRILAIFFTMAAILVGIIVYQNVLMDVDSKTDIRMVFNLLIAVFTGLATALNKIYWPETSFHDFITCRRVIDKFSVVCRLQNTCTGCLTAHLLNKHGVIVWSASGGHLSLTGQAFDTSKFNNLIIDRDGITTCLHRAGFFIVHAFETLANDYEDYMENNFVDSTMFPCDKLLKATIKVQERLYLAKSKVAFLVKTGKSYSGFADVRGVVYYYSDNSCKLHWLKKPVLVQPRTTPITPTNFIR
ncbi:hypothetical protein GQ42DRAFT_47602 [Ramicandelaber brevisporus]|nr:hypothetical protein GQ42DRAFT_47602 [Ramicandelaber brevisporus]